MFASSETSILGIILLVAFTILGWGFYRARPFGKLGILAWLQSVVLMAPWLLFFGLFAAGIYINIVGILFLVVGSAGLYIYLGRQLRSLGQDAILKQRATERLAAESSPAPENIPQPVGVVVEIMPIPEEDLNVIKGIFGIDTFFATETIAYQEGAIFKGNLRGEPQEVHTRLSKSLQDKLGDKYRLFLVENTDTKPVVIVLPSTNDPRPTTLPQKAFAAILAIATIGTSLETAGLLLNFDLFSTPARLQEALPIGVGIFAILVAHEIGHWLVARRHQVRLSWPFFLPAVQIGSFGAITRFESLLPNRSVLFDIAVAGPIAGGIVSLLMLIVGLLLSHQGSLFQLPNQFFQGSILVGSLARVVLGSALQSPLVNVHPLVIIGWLGLVITALNLMPAGSLDGGRIIQAIYGRKTAGRATFATLIVLALVSLGNALAMYWAIVILFLQRDLERPNLNEISEPDDARAALCLLVLFLMITTLLPLTPALAGRLGIGG
ncbi:Peptidase M50 [Trichormus variabilis ATCC 29413]|uniref:Peptidase M50 n=2 Tax=Anabaena variabilis TaxID=264691 RepID=Q3ME92_TRIV2|nr:MULTISPECIES: site-2 protease family protein [Nostocaceae]ABA20694.1 Peptidase M50 [Trichormus variabilis ATCC 29413]MBC1214413.1 site-2 protease family protein [Trichormus variabilis ARAD]MBC1254557.1 site-2 protease family protein [Trichormus variabilis V5]MBC1267780.1 site-2 protease family protein [Trichormus variabilis FSR]MBC1300881.1 site-2 protease family protein [Trichormus variabilis N2B]